MRRLLSFIVYEGGELSPGYCVGYIAWVIASKRSSPGILSVGEGDAVFTLTTYVSTFLPRHEPFVEIKLEDSLDVWGSVFEILSRLQEKFPTRGPFQALPSSPIYQAATEDT